ncbi:YggS family pyridoxal phosphate-dependent enzyme [Gordonia sp. NPDC003376]
MTDARTAELAQRLGGVRERLTAAVDAAGRAPGEVELLVVTKFFPAGDVTRLIGLGEREFGESREPEASRKIAEIADEVSSSGAVFDMIGTVQTKKARTVARWARSVHSVDRDRLVEALDRGASAALDTGERSDPLGVFVQVSLDGDPERGGVVEAGLPVLAEQVADSAALRLRGLMAITPLSGEPRHWMAELARVRSGFLDRYPEAGELSAGMSGDMELAVEYGSTCVRVGTAIMGSRPILSQ